MPVWETRRDWLEILEETEGLSQKQMKMMFEGEKGQMLQRSTKIKTQHCPPLTEAENGPWVLEHTEDKHGS